MCRRIVVLGLVICLWLSGKPCPADARAANAYGMCAEGSTSFTTEGSAARPVNAPADSELYARAAVLMDGKSGRVLFEKNGQEVLPMASTTKIMTCIVALETADLDEKVSISAYAASMPKVKMYVKKGENYRLGDLLYSLMLESHNDVAVAIAEHIGKDFLGDELKEKSAADFTTEESKRAVAAFADLMNEKAVELRCENTWFITPNGLDATETFKQNNAEEGMGEMLTDETVKMHSTTAQDLARIMSYCVCHSPKKEEFLKITQTPSYTVTSAEGRNSFCTNHNAFLNMMEGAVSGKTGFTNLAGYCYVGAVEHEGNVYVVALLACGWPNNKTYKWSDTKKLMRYGIEEYAYRKIQDSDKVLDLPEYLTVRNGQTSYLGQSAYVPIQIVPSQMQGEFWGESEGLLMREEENMILNYQMVEVLDAPVHKGDVIGVITHEIDGKIYKREDIVAGADVAKIDFKWCFWEVVDGFLQ